MPSMAFKKTVFDLVAKHATCFKGELEPSTPLKALGLDAVALEALAIAFGTEMGIDVTVDDLTFPATMTGLLATVDAQGLKQAEETAHERMESAAREAFDATYPPAYLAQLTKDSTGHGRDLVELLWASFANGFQAGHTHPPI